MDITHDDEIFCVINCACEIEFEGSSEEEPLQMFSLILFLKIKFRVAIGDFLQHCWNLELLISIFLLERPILLFQNIDVGIYFFAAEAGLEVLEYFSTLINIINHLLDLINGILPNFSLELVDKSLLVLFVLGSLVEKTDLEESLVMFEELIFIVEVGENCDNLFDLIIYFSFWLFSSHEFITILGQIKVLESFFILELLISEILECLQNLLLNIRVGFEATG